MFIENLYLEITRNCNLECEHCLRGDSKNEYMSSQTINNIFKDIKGIDRLLLTGGEPLLAINQIKEIISIIKTNNIKINSIMLITNGTILNENVIETLKELSSISVLHLRLSYDMFHFLELNRLKLFDIRVKNAIVFKELFNALDYASFDDTSFSNKKVIMPIGRALKLSSERLEEINNMSDSKYSLSEYCVEKNPWSSFNASYNLFNYVVDGTISIDVNSNVVAYSLPFDDEDAEKLKYNSNINEIGLSRAILNYIEYYEELRDHMYKSLGLRLK